MNFLAHRRGRGVIPPVGWLVLWALALLSVDLFREVVVRTLFAGIAADDPHVTDYLRKLLGMHAVVIGLAVVAHAVRRFALFVPLPGSPYHAWLERTPWEPSRPLPLGPWRPAWGDALVVGGLTAYACRFGPVGLLVPLGYLAAWTAIATVTLPNLGRERHAIGVLLVLGIGAHLVWWRPGAALAVLPVAWTIAFDGIRRAVRELPFWTARQEARGRTPSLVRREGLPTFDLRKLGWPHAWLSPRPALPAVDVPMAFAWVAVGVTWLVAAPWQREGTFLAFLLVLVVAGARLFVYVVGCRASPTPLARLATGRWLVPAYDRVFVAPLLAFVSGGAFAWATRHGWLPPRVGCPLTIGVPLLFALGMGPTLLEWHLTGAHRCAPTRRAFGAERSPPGRG